MIGDRRLQMVLDLDTGGYTSSLSDASAKLSTFAGQVETTSSAMKTASGTFSSFGSSLQSPLQSLRDYVLVLSNIRFALMDVREVAIGWIESLVNQSRELERTQVLMKGLSGDIDPKKATRQAADDMSRLFEMSRNTGFSVDQLSNTFVRIKSTGIDPMHGSMQALVNSVAAFGGNDQTMQHVSLAFQEMADKGVLSMKELRRQFAIQVPDGMRVMAEALGMTMDEMVKKISHGEVAAKPALELFTNTMGIIHAGAAEKLAQTLTGQMNTLKTNMMEMSLAFTGEAETNAKSLYSIITQAFRDINTASKSVNVGLIFHNVGEAVAGIAAHLRSLIEVLIDWRAQLGFVGQFMLTVFAATTFASWGKSAIISIMGVKAAITSWMAESALIVTATMQQIDYNTQVAFGTIQAENSVKAIQARASAELAEADIQATLAASELQHAEAAKLASQAKVVMLEQEQAKRSSLILTIQQELLVNERQLLSGRNLQGQFVSKALALDAVTRATAVLAAQETGLTIVDDNLMRATTANTNATMTLIGAQNMLAVTEDIVVAATVREEVAIASNNTAMVVWEALTAGVAAVTGVLTLALEMLAGPLGIAAILAYQLASAFGVLETSADNAAKAADRMRSGFASAADAAIVAKQMSDLATRSSELDKQISENGGGIGRDGIADSRSRLDALKREKTEITAQMAELRSSVAAGHEHDNEKDLAADRKKYAKGEEDFKVHLNEMSSAERANDLKITNDDQRVAALKIVDNRNQSLLAKHDSEVYIHEQARVAAMTDHTSQAYKNAVTALGELYDSRAKDNSESLRSQVNAAGLTKGLKAQHHEMGRAAGELAKLNAQLRGGAGNMAKFNAELAHGGFEGKTTEYINEMRAVAGAQDALSAHRKRAAADNTYEKRLGSMAAKLAELRDHLSQTGTALEKLNIEIEHDPKLKGDGANRLAVLREIAAEQDKQIHDNKIGDMMKGFNTDLEKATMDAQNLWNEYGTGIEKADKKTAALRASLTAKLMTEKLSTKEMADGLALIEKVVNALKEAESVSITQNWIKEANTINDALAVGVTKREASFAREKILQKTLLDQQLANIDKLGLKEEEAARRKHALTGAYTQWVLANDSRIERANESATVKMARDWSSLGSNIEGAMATAIGSFVDGMANANLDFGKFAEDLIKNILKIIVEAMIAYAIMSAIGMANNSKGEHVSMGDFMKGQLKGSFGLGGSAGNAATDIGHKAAVKVPGAHTGGIIGSGLSTWGGVDPSVFAKAASYHSGGYIGTRPLGPGEIPIIGKANELVLTEQQQSSIGDRLNSGSGGGGAGNVQVNIINNSGTQLNAQQSDPLMNGKDMIVNIVVEAAQQQGKLRDVLQGMHK